MYYSANFSYPRVYLREVPGEIALGISISGCTIHCKGCHSSETWNPKFGEALNDEAIQKLLDKNPGITAFLIYGGEWCLRDVFTAMDYIKNHTDLKIAFYSGLDTFIELPEFHDLIDYYKIGSYREELGGLDSDNTNQKMYKKIDGSFKQINMKGELV